MKIFLKSRAIREYDMEIDLDDHDVDTANFLSFILEKDSIDNDDISNYVEENSFNTNYDHDLKMTTYNPNPIGFIAKNFHDAQKLKDAIQNYLVEKKLREEKKEGQMELNYD